MIKEISFTRFRGHEAKYVLSPGRNLIKGPNESGKSTIKEAIAFAWMGTDSAGAKNPDHLITVGQDSSEVRFTTPKSTIIRRKKRGATSEIKIARDGIPDVKVSQSDLMAQIGISPEVFMSSWVVGYFMSLKADAKLKVLGEIAKVDRKALLSSLVDITQLPAQVKFINPKIDADAIAGIRRAEQNKKQAITATQAASLQQLHNMPQAAIDINPETHRALIAEVEAQLHEHNLYKQNLPRWKAENDKRSTAKTEVEKLKVEMEIASSKSEDLKAAANNIALQRDQTMANGKVLSAQMEKLLKTKKEVELTIPHKPNVKAGECPTCLSVVGEDRVAALMKPYEEAVEEYNKHSRKVADFNKKVDEKALEINKQIDAARELYNKQSAEYSSIYAEEAASRKYHATLLANFNATSKIPSELLPAPQPPVGVESELVAQRDNAKQQLHEFNLFNTQRERLQSDIKTNSELIDKHTAEIERLSVMEKALLELPAMETKATLDTVKIPGINMVLTDGDLVVTNEEGVDYRCLSDGRRMKVDVEICLAIKRAEPRSPDWIFVDNADLMDEKVLPPANIQVLIAHVDSEVSEVEVVHL